MVVLAGDTPTVAALRFSAIRDGLHQQREGGDGRLVQGPPGASGMFECFFECFHLMLSTDGLSGFAGSQSRCFFSVPRTPFFWTVSFCDCEVRTGRCVCRLVFLHNAGGVGCSCLRCRCASVNFFLRTSVNSSDVHVVNVTFCDGPALVLFVTHAGPRRPPRKAV